MRSKKTKAEEENAKSETASSFCIPENICSLFLTQGTLDIVVLTEEKEKGKEENEKQNEEEETSLSSSSSSPSSSSTGFNVEESLALAESWLRLVNAQLRFLKISLKRQQLEEEEADGGGHVPHRLGAIRGHGSRWRVGLAPCS